MAKAEQAERDRLIDEVKQAKKRVENQEKEYRQKLFDTFRGKAIVFTGMLEGEDMFGQDGVEMYDSHDYLSEERLVVTHIFFTPERYGFRRPQTPLIHATREQHHRKGQRGGNVSFRLLTARKVEVVE